MDENRKMISIRLPPDVLKALDAWRSEQEVPPQRTAVILEAVRRFLADHNRKPTKR